MKWLTVWLESRKKIFIQDCLEVQRERERESEKEREREMKRLCQTFYWDRGISDETCIMYSSRASKTSKLH